MHRSSQSVNLKLQQVGFFTDKLAFIFCRSSTSVMMDGLYALVVVQ